MMKPLRRTRTALAAMAIAALTFGTEATPANAAEPLAKELFGAKKLPAATPPQSIGFYSKGCFAGGVAIAADGTHWQAMRLSRNRRWGHPTMIALVEKLSRDAAEKDGWPGLLLGDISQPRGGPMLTGHASHQIGLDADIWFNPMPARRYSAEERETVSAVSMIRKGGRYVDDKIWTSAHMRLLRRAAGYPEVERILVNPGIKKKLCETVSGDRAWLQKVRPFWGHDYHFHVRIGCQPGSPGCKPQAAVKGGEGCGDELSWWFTKAAQLPANNDDSPKARDLMTMKSLPAACRSVLDAPSPSSEAAVTLRGPDTVVTVAAAQEADPVPSPDASASDLPGTANAHLPTPDVHGPVPRPRPEN